MFDLDCLVMKVRNDVVLARIYKLCERVRYHENGGTIYNNITRTYSRQIKFSNFRNIRQSLHMNKSHILEYERKW